MKGKRAIRTIVPLLSPPSSPQLPDDARASTANRPVAVETRSVLLVSGDMGMMKTSESSKQKVNTTSKSKEPIAYSSFESVSTALVGIKTLNSFADVEEINKPEGGEITEHQGVK